MASAKYESSTPRPLDVESHDTESTPKDGGKGAWLFLFGACIVEIAAWGKYSSIDAEGCG